MTRVAILDYGMGNLRSVEKAFERIGVEAEVTARAERAREADGLVLPGVGAFSKAMGEIRERGLDRLIEEAVEADTPVLGLCLGFQLMFESSTELGGAQGLGLLHGTVDELDARGLKVPHIGWEPVRWERDSPLVAGIPDGTPFYFVHGFVPRVDDPSDLLGTAMHGTRFACAIEHPPLYGVQFHPEKSSIAGRALLANFARIASGGSDASSPGAETGAPLGGAAR